MFKSGQQGASDAGGRKALAPRLPARWTAIVIAALLAFSWQSVVTQTHVHAPGYPSAAGKSDGPQQLSAKRSSPDLPANCPLCREIAHAGAYLMPTQGALRVPAPAPVWLAVTEATWLALNQRSHAWQSRAPPTTLQA